jgi:hypothetical protein
MGDAVNGVPEDIQIPLLCEQQVPPRRDADGWVEVAL